MGVEIPAGSKRTSFDIDSLDWDKGGGLLPVIVQHAHSLEVLMLGYADRTALEATLATGRLTFHSRSRNRLWTKGEASGNFLDLVSMKADCDRDTLLILALPHGPTCHLGTSSCFPAAPKLFLGELDALVASRVRERPAGSYTTRLLEAGIPRIAQKVGEEGVEVALAAVMAPAATAPRGTAPIARVAAESAADLPTDGTGEQPGQRGATPAAGTALLNEAADLVYHLLVLLRVSGHPLSDLDGMLAARHADANTP